MLLKEFVNDSLENKGFISINHVIHIASNIPWISTMGLDHRLIVF